jgi:A/G-specific adenine glycosylase
MGRKSAKPTLHLVPPTGMLGNAPPRTLAEHGGSLWNRVMTEYQIEDGIAELGRVLRPIGLWRRRAVALKALAAEMVQRRGSFPVVRGEIQALPAAGQYVASAVLLFAYSRPEPLLDNNMARVLERVFEPRRLADIRYDPWLQALARALVRSKRSAEVNWAVLDIAALHCRPAKPACTDCPLQRKCNYVLGSQHPR